MALPKDYHLQMVAGDKYQLLIDYVDEDNLPIDITGEAVTLKVYSGEELLFTLTEGSGLVNGGATGRITVNLTSAQTDTLDGRANRRYVLRLNNSERTILIGKVGVNLAV